MNQLITDPAYDAAEKVTCVDLLPEISQNSNPNSKIITITYDSADRVMTQKNPDGEVINYTYNNQGLVEGISLAVNNIHYNALGKITDKVYPNGKTTALTYNADDFRLNYMDINILYSNSY